MKNDDIDPVLKALFLPENEPDNIPEIPNIVGEMFHNARFSLGPIKTLEKKSDEWDELIVVPVQKAASVNVDGQRLEKAYDGMRQSTRRIALEHFIRKSLAMGETVNSLAEHAEKFDPETAREIRVIGARLAA